MDACQRISEDAAGARPVESAKGAQATASGSSLHLDLVPAGKLLVISGRGGGRDRWFVETGAMQLEIVRTLREAQYGRICACLPVLRQADGGFAHAKPAVALKMFSKADVARRHGRLSNSRIAEDAVAELAAWARVSVDASSHPNVARLLDVAQDERRIFAVTELASSDLFDWASQANFRLPLFLTRVLCAEIAHGLHHLHHHCHIAHRDLSLENTTVHFLPSRVPVLKIIDFGLCAQMGTPPEHERCIPVERSGKCAYMAPEVFNASVKSYDPYKADVWALGISFFILLSGTQPYEIPITAEQARRSGLATPASSAFDLISDGRTQEALVACGAHKDAVAAAGELIASMLAINPADRPTVAAILQRPFLSEVTFPEDLASLYSDSAQPAEWKYANEAALEEVALGLARRTGGPTTGLHAPSGPPTAAPATPGMEEEEEEEEGGRGHEAGCSGAQGGRGATPCRPSVRRQRSDSVPAMDEEAVDKAGPRPPGRTEPQRSAPASDIYTAQRNSSDNATVASRTANDSNPLWHSDSAESPRSAPSAVDIDRADSPLRAD